LQPGYGMSDLPLLFFVLTEISKKSLCQLRKTIMTESEYL
jgi:hypothetical protein